MSSLLPMARSTGPRWLFALGALGSVAVLWGTQAAGVQPDPWGLTLIYRLLFTRFDYWGAICSLLILIAALFVPLRTAAGPCLRWIGTHPGTMAAGVFVLLCVGSLSIYQNQRLAMDEYAQFFQSQIFAAGHLAGRFPAPLIDWLVPEGFQNYFLFVSRESGAVAASYWPSFALLLTPFTFIGMSWACNPLISALTLIAIHRLALRLFQDPESAGLAMLFTLASPVFFANGISYYSMPAHLLANTVFALLLIEPTPRRVFTAGLVGSVALTLHNPVPHMLFALPWLIWLATLPNRKRLMAAAAAGYAPLCIALGLGWFWLTTDLRQSHLDAVAAAGTRLDQVKRLAQAVGLPDSRMMVARLIGVAKVWVWATPCLLIVAAVGAFRRRSETFCVLILFSALCTFVGFLFVPLDQGHGWGFRYFHSAWVALPILAAGAVAGPRTASGALFQDEPSRTFIVSCALLSVTFAVGLRAWQIHEFMTFNRAQEPGYTSSERRVEIIDPSFSFYGADRVQNDPWLRGDVIRLVTRGRAQDREMMREYFPEFRQVYADRYGSVWTPPTHAAAGPSR